eukprot:CAMPEP_0114584080 /NCGR_PEP_ID=MMETSP0125-20121206/7794_1 /TAXON_ID=485358 ORGANISM="Aristerostoma sp., Strain ATCC 50986" /NCGR_SAMPLE_ID=MMETSP0125 /ASSEMBLY_ACC=CAM_ASM_000245 /LENGTH=70 /DNA_ID=CAMNT_0001778141 /DNA_START=773 /DNA_END=985 /DNA_ORIENTATION=+
MKDIKKLISHIGKHKEMKFEKILSIDGNIKSPHVLFQPWFTNGDVMVVIKTTTGLKIGAYRREKLALQDS